MKLSEIFLVFMMALLTFVTIDYMVVKNAPIMVAVPVIVQQMPQDYESPVPEASPTPNYPSPDMKGKI